MARLKKNHHLALAGQGPLYKQVEQGILRELADGEWLPGEQLPSEIELATRFGVGLQTVRAGIAGLAEAKILVRRQGKGTFVALHGHHYQRYHFSHLYDTEGRHFKPRRRLVSFRKTLATPDERRRLALPPGSKTQVVRIELHCTNGGLNDNQTASLLEICLPAVPFATLTEAAVRDQQRHLYAVYQDLCRINVIRIEEQVHAVIATPKIARLMKLPQGSPILHIDRVAYTYDDRPVEYRKRFFNAAHYHFRSSQVGQ